jgi:hypothetical protein
MDAYRLRLSAKLSPALPGEPVAAKNQPMPYRETAPGLRRTAWPYSVTASGIRNPRGCFARATGLASGPYSLMYCVRSMIGGRIANGADVPPCAVPENEPENEPDKPVLPLLVKPLAPAPP